MAEQTVELQPSESKPVSFEAIPHEAKTYHVSVNGLSGSFIAIPAVPSMAITRWAYIKDSTPVTLRDPMTDMSRVNYIGFRFENYEPEAVANVSVVFKVIDGGEEELSPPRDRYLNPITQPFMAPVGRKDIWYRWRPIYSHYRAEAEVWAAGTLVATDFREFDVRE